MIGDPGPNNIFDGGLRPWRDDPARAATRIGDDDFFRLLKRWTASQAGGNVARRSSPGLAERVSGENLDAFFRSGCSRRRNQPDSMLLRVGPKLEPRRRPGPGSCHTLPAADHPVTGAAGVAGIVSERQRRSWTENERQRTQPRRAPRSHCPPRSRSTARPAASSTSIWAAGRPGFDHRSSWTANLMAGYDTTRTSKAAARAAAQLLAGRRRPDLGSLEGRSAGYATETCGLEAPEKQSEHRSEQGKPAPDAAMTLRPPSSPTAARTGHLRNPWHLERPATNRRRAATHPTPPTTPRTSGSKDTLDDRLGGNQDHDHGRGQQAHQAVTTPVTASTHANHTPSAPKPTQGYQTDRGSGATADKPAAPHLAAAPTANRDVTATDSSPQTPATADREASRIQQQPRTTPARLPRFLQPTSA